MPGDKARSAMSTNCRNPNATLTAARGTSGSFESEEPFIVSNTTNA